MAVDDSSAEIGFRKGGYLFIVPAHGARVLEENVAVQRRHGVKVDLLDRAALKSRLPSMFVEDLAAAAHFPDDGWLDPYAVLIGFRRKAIALGARFIADEVVGIERQGVLVRRVALASGQSLAADYVVNAAGARADEICRTIGMATPILPMRRYEHYFASETAIEPLPT